MISIDHLENKIQLKESPKRIISTVPSQTELLFDLGLEQEIIGITKFCIHPKEKVENCQKIGGTKNLNIEKIIKLKPDLIIANKEENTKEQIETLQKHFPVWISDTNSVESAQNLILEIGQLTNKAEEAKVLFDSIIKEFEQYKTSAKGKRIAYFIWRKPWMFAGKGTYIDAVLNHFGFINCINETRYPSLEIDKIKALKPEMLLLSSEPYPFKEKHIKELQEHFQDIPIHLVDGEIFSWYGSRQKYTPKYISNFINQTIKN